jgi:hypothetical protein
MAGPMTARQSVLLRLSPLTLSRIAVGFALIAALWLAVGSSHGEIIAVAAAFAVAISGHAGRVLAGRQPVAGVQWSLAGCGLLSEFVIYAGIAAGISLHAGLAPGVAGSTLSGTFIGHLGGAGSTGVWRLAVIAVILSAVAAMVDLCVHGPALPGTRLRLFGPPGDIRLPVACFTVLLFGARAGFLVALILTVAVLGLTVSDGTRQGTDRGPVRGYRGDGRLSIWIGRWLDGRVPPLAPLVVGLLVTGVLAALGLGHLPALLLLAPVEAMLLATIASWHPHDGPADWLVPPLIQAAEYVFLAEVGFAKHVWPALTFALVAVVGLRHLDLAYRVRGGLAAGIDRTGLGWEGRMILVGVTAALGFAPAAYVLLALYLGYRLARDWMIGWAARLAPATE